MAVPASYLSVTAGCLLLTGGNCSDPNVQTVGVADVFLHPQYDVTSVHNNIAVLQLARPVMYAGNIRPICLPPASTDINQFESCATAAVATPSDLVCKYAVT